MNDDTKFDPRKIDLAEDEDLLPDIFPELTNLSAVHIYGFVPKPNEVEPPEFFYVPIEKEHSWSNEKYAKICLTITYWNAAWEAGHLQSKFVTDIWEETIPKELKWLEEIGTANLYLIPDVRNSAFEAFRPLYHLLPLKTLNRFQLPLLKRGIWPPWDYSQNIDYHITSVFDDRFAEAFAAYIWPYLISGSRIEAFTKNDPIKLLAHNLNFWLPCIYILAEQRMEKFPRVEFDNEKQIIKLEELRNNMPSDIQANRPLSGGSIWKGEHEAQEATKELLEIADKNGQLRGIIDAVKSNRVEDDFSNIWSYAKEDFERKIYHKRTKVKVTFVELDEAKPVHAATSELHENLLWEDFFAMLDMKEKRIVVCLKNGITKHTEIAQKIGYANHSSVSKKLKIIREKAKKLLVM